MDNNSVEPESGQESLHATPLQYFSHSAMACEFTIFFNQNQYPNCGDGATSCFDLIDEIEDRLPAEGQLRTRIEAFLEMVE